MIGSIVIVLTVIGSKSEATLAALIAVIIIFNIFVIIGDAFNSNTNAVDLLLIQSRIIVNQGLEPDGKHEAKKKARNHHIRL